MLDDGCYVHVFTRSIEQRKIFEEKQKRKGLILKVGQGRKMVLGVYFVKS